MPPAELICHCDRTIQQQQSTYTQRQLGDALRVVTAAAVHRHAAPDGIGWFLIGLATHTVSHTKKNILVPGTLTHQAVCITQNGSQTTGRRKWRGLFLCEVRGTRSTYNDGTPLKALSHPIPHPNRFPKKSNPRAPPDGVGYAKSGAISSIDHVFAARTAADEHSQMTNPGCSSTCVVMLLL